MIVHHDLPKTSTQQAADSAARESVTIGQVLVDEGGGAMRGWQAGSKKWASWAQEALQANLQAGRELLGCRTAKAAMVVHTNLMHTHLKLMAQNGRGIMVSGWATALKASPPNG